MSINLRTGQPGHGKSYGAVREIVNALNAGKFVATNVPLADDWAEQMARLNIARRLVRGRVDSVAAEFRMRLYVVDDLGVLGRLRLPPCGRCPGCRKGPGCQKESRGVAVLDEAHKWLNARTWDADHTGRAQTKAEAVALRLAIVGFFSTHRHFGWDIELITQDEQNLDRQVRGLFETHTHLKNLRRFRPLGFPLFPINLFVAVKHWHDNDKTRLGADVYPLNKRLARCYDTFGAARHIPDGPDVIYLGRDLDAIDASGRPAGAPKAPPDARTLPATASDPGHDDEAEIDAEREHGAELADARGL